MRRLLKERHFYLLASPFFILFAIFGLYPLAFSFYISFVKWNGLNEIKWVGLDNYWVMLTDPVFRGSILNTIIIGFLYIPLMMALSFILANALNSGWLRARNTFRALFFLPSVTPMVALAVVFGLLYGEETGLINYALEGLGISAIPWLGDATYSKPAIAIMVLWRWTGYNMIIMLAGLQGIDHSYYEAARIDGANAWQRLWTITFPLMRPVFAFVLITSLIGTAYMFDEVFVLTQGGPGTSTMTFGLYLFDLSFRYYKFGYASALAYTMAFVVFVATMIVMQMEKRNQQ